MPHKNEDGRWVADEGYNDTRRAALATYVAAAAFTRKEWNVFMSTVSHCPVDLIIMKDGIMLMFDAKFRDRPTNWMPTPKQLALGVKFAVVNSATEVRLFNGDKTSFTLPDEITA